MDLSVIIPTFNRDDFLIRAIYSVLCEKDIDLEVIVIDDGSNSEILKKIIEYFPFENRVNYFKNKNEKSGAAFSRNYGVSLAKGEFVTFLDDDDIYMPGRLKSMFYFFKENKKYSLVSSGRFSEFNDFNHIENKVNRIFGEFYIEDIKNFNDIDIGFMIRRDRFIKSGGFDVNLISLEDWDFIIRILKNGMAFKIKRFDYCVNSGEGRVRVSNNSYVGMIDLAKKHRKYFGDIWFYSRLCDAEVLNNSLYFFKALKISIKIKSFYPIKIYFKNLLKYFLSILFSKY